MKMLINRALVFSLALVVAGCANMDPGVSLSDQDVARLMAIDDKLIVPGERIGPIFIGMTETNLYKKLGNPSTTVRGSDGTWIRYGYNNSGLSTQVNPSTHKVNVVDNYQQTYFPYSTREGITVGSSELQTQVLPWKLLWKKESPYGQCWTFQYTGMRVFTCNGIVTSIAVHSAN
jgi:hypothetical protein